MNKATITKLQHKLIVPSSPTPSGELPLSWLDKHIGNRRTMALLSVYLHGDNPAEVIQNAVSKALVKYYPLAGRIVESTDKNGELIVACNAQGVWFVEASASCSLRDVGYLDYPLMVPDDLLLPSPSNATNDSLDTPLLIQVTSFACGGFAVGVIMNHIMMDGVGTGQFLRAVAEAARRVEPPTEPEPIWYRNMLPKFVNSSQPSELPIIHRQNFHHEKSFQPVLAIIDISTENINKVESSEIFTTFEVLTAKLWQCRTRVIKEEIGPEVHLLFPLDMRPYINVEETFPTQGNYYGNLNYAIVVSAPTETVLDAAVHELVNLINEAKQKAWNEYFKGQQDPMNLLSYYGTMIVRDWKAVGVSDVDYGWGTPVSNGPLRIGEDIALCFQVESPKVERGTRLITYCVKKEHSEEFQQQLITACMQLK